MTDQGPLVVPIVVEAMLANDEVRSSPNANSHITFWRTEMAYALLGTSGNAEPSGTTGNDADFYKTGQQGDEDYSTYYNGVYLKWRLPDALRRGQQDAVKGVTNFPLVPNRWLVIRSAGPAGSDNAPTTRTVTAWIVQSDYQSAQLPPLNSYADRSSLYWASDASGFAAPIYLGLVTPLSADWLEPGTPMYLAAVAPGNPAFSVSQTDCNNVFSMFDPLALQDVPDQTILSYQVIGWYSDPTQDPLADARSAQAFADRLKALNWVLPDKTDPAWTATSSVYSGFLGGIFWQSDKAPPAGTGIAPTVAIGNTSVEALTALLTFEAEGSTPPPSPPLDPQLLQAFQFDLLSEYDQPDGPALVAEKLRNASFQHIPGGYGWQIVDAPGQWPPLSQAERAKEAEWLAVLNLQQIAFDEAQRALSGLQDQLYAMWWKWAGWRYLNPPDYLTQDQLGQQLDPTASGSLAAQVQAQANNVAQLGRLVPQGATQFELAEAIAFYAGSKDLPPSRQLKRFAQPRFAAPNPPVLLVAGAGAAGIYNPQGSLTCRFVSQLVTGFVDSAYSPNAITAATPNLAIPVSSVLSVQGGPSAAVVQSLINEAFFLDASNAGIVAAAIAAPVAGVAAAMSDWQNAVPVPPPVAGAIWQGRNPWRPLYLYWAATYVPIPFGTPDAPNWQFDGETYEWNGDEPPAQLQVGLNGRILLTPQATLNMQAQIKKFLASNPNLPEAANFQELLDFIAAHDGVKGAADPDDAPWDLLSQALTGFNEQLLQRQAGVFKSPDSYSPAPVPLYGNAPGFPPNPNAPGTFQPWRAGQFYFTKLMIVDEWGQSLTIVDADNYEQAAIASPDDMVPQIPLSLPADSIIALPSALLQPARLDFSLVSGVDDHALVGLSADANPICGWVVPNHLDHALMAYDGNGAALGELAVGVLGSGNHAVIWTPAPGNPLSHIPPIPQFGAFLTALQQGSVAAFRDFLAGIDETLWTTVPTGAAMYDNLAILIGRPLAFVRARLVLELDGPAALDPSWQYTLDPATPDLPTYSFAIELGNLARIDDGLIGYFVGSDYHHFNIVTASGASSDGYLQPIGANNNYIFTKFVTAPIVPSQATYVSMLVDPRAPVHATSGILPDVTLSLPPSQVAAALSAINVTFRVGPVLTESNQPVGASLPTVLMPLPSDKGSVWSWQQQDQPGTWTTYPVASPTPNADLSPVAPVLRRGLLQLTKPFD